MLRIHSAKVGKNIRRVKYQIAILYIVFIEFVYLSLDAILIIAFGSGSFSEGLNRSIGTSSIHEPRTLCVAMTTAHLHAISGHCSGKYQIIGNGLAITGDIFMTIGLQLPGQ